MKYFIGILFLFSTFSGPVFAQERQVVDTITTVASTPKLRQLEKTSIQKRIPSKDDMQQFRDDEAFNYGESERPGYPRWILRILDWIDSLTNDFMRAVFTRNTITVIFIVLVVTLLVAIILRMQNVSIRNLFSRQKLNQEESEFYEEDVNRMNFEQLITQAVDNKNYRLAVRFLYLKNLKALSDRLIINWNPNKTNYSYVDEIKIESLKGKFQESTLIFDFVWYGEFVLNENTFHEAYRLFNEFNRMISNER